MKITAGSLRIERCPHCGVADPYLLPQGNFDTQAVIQRGVDKWWTFACRSCGGAIIAQTHGADHEQRVIALFPRAASDETPEELPPRARALLTEAIRSLVGGAPAASIMAAASSVDSMLKAKGYREGSLYARIDKAASDQVITPDMAKWAHQVRLDANDQRHADEEALIPQAADAKLCVEFVVTLGEVMFVLPARVTRGIETTGAEAKR